MWNSALGRRCTGTNSPTYHQLSLNHKSLQASRISSVCEPPNPSASPTNTKHRQREGDQSKARLLMAVEQTHQRLESNRAPQHSLHTEREWAYSCEEEWALTSPSAESWAFTVCTYNILADQYVRISKWQQCTMLAAKGVWPLMSSSCPGVVGHV